MLTHHALEMLRRRKFYELARFLDDGRIDLDNNAVERAIGPLALNRKNALFAGSDEGGDNWAATTGR
jgi:hypothetical protein